MKDLIEYIRISIRPRHIVLIVLSLFLAGVIIPESFTPGSTEPQTEQPANVETSDTVATATPTSTPIATVEQQANDDPLATSRIWVNAYSTYTLVEGSPVAPGTLVLAYDPDGTLIGRTEVSRDGAYGLMALYGDDPATDEDEGATPGDRISFTIGGLPALTMGPDDPVWDSNGSLLQIDLLVE